jgi:hypothetical protein
MIGGILDIDKNAKSLMVPPPFQLEMPMRKIASFILAMQVVCVLCGCKEWHEAAYDYTQNATDFRGDGGANLQCTPYPDGLLTADRPPAIDHPAPPKSNAP